MKPFTRVIPFLIFAFGFLALPLLQAQDNNNPQIFAIVDFMKSEYGMSDKYEQVEKKYWKKIHAARVESGEILGWYFYQRKYPFGANSKYDYVTVTVYNDFTRLENPFSDVEGTLAKALPDMDAEKVMEKTGKTRKLVRGEVYRLIDQAAPPETKPGKFIMVNFMKTTPGMSQEYVAMERDYYKKQHQMAIEAGARKNWLLWAKQLPYGTKEWSNFTTVDAYDSMAQMMQPMPKDAEAKIKEKLGMSPSEAYEKMSKTRDLLRGEMWELLDYVEAPQQTMSTGN